MVYLINVCLFYCPYIISCAKGLIPPKRHQIGRFTEKFSKNFFRFFCRSDSLTEKKRASALLKPVIYIMFLLRLLCSIYWRCSRCSTRCSRWCCCCSIINLFLYCRFLNWCITWFRSEHIYS
jgi:hypothetical protein